MGISSTAFIGAEGTLGYFNPELCSQSPSTTPSWSLAWLSLDGGSPSCDTCGVNIFQGGLAKCPSINSCPWNNGAVDYWWFYARETGNCGIHAESAFTKVANATAGNHIFKISRILDQGHAVYAFYVDGLIEHEADASALDTCWGHSGGPIGVQAAEWQHEMLDKNDHLMGTVSLHQAFTNIMYQNAAGWHNVSWTLGRACDANSNPVDWSCFVASASHNTYYTFDRRAP